jgi:hypothetical protein
MWKENLKGKNCFVADSIVKLQERVESNKTLFLDTVVSRYNGDYPFRIDNGNYFRFCYYDPYYELKLAREQGKKIECKRKGDAWGDWDYASEPLWIDNFEYRIQPEGTNLVTNRELARWLAEGNGEYQMRKGDQFSCFNEYSYDAQDANEPTEIPCVRKWNDSEWHEPTREYLGL